jgi:hypothetical protein
MGYVPGFDNDIFISYSHKDDQAVEGPGWVSNFHHHLVIEVEEALGADVHVWRDKRITGATNFPKELDRQVRRSAMLVAILSPAYLNSAWCDWELTGFARSLRVGDLWVDTRCRAIKVFKRPADVAKLRVLAETEGVNLFDVDPETGHAHEMEGAPQRFKHRLTELGHDIAFVLKQMRKARTVFLGTAAAALHDQRERVAHELNGRAYRTLTTPDGPADDMPTLVRAAIRESALSVLFYDRVAAAGDSTEAAAALERRVAMDEQATQIVVVRERADAAVQPWDEPGATGRGSAKVEWLLDPQVHTLYHTVLQMLEMAAPVADAGHSAADDVPPPAIAASPPAIPAVNPAASPATITPSTPTEGAGPRKLVRVYLICDQRDHPLLELNRARRLRDHLLALGFEVKLPLAEHDDVAQFSRDNRAKLKQCDAVLLYWGTSRQAWFEERIRELAQARGWRNNREFVMKGAYLADPLSPVKENFETNDLDELIKQFDDLDPTDTRLTRFVARLERTS